MSDVLYVYPNGHAHTVDQAHEMALHYHFWLDTMPGRIKQLSDAWSAAIAEMGYTFQELAERMRGVFGSVETAVIAVQEHKKRRRAFYQENKRQRRPQFVKTYMKNQFAIQKPTDGIRFRRNQRG